MSQTRSLASIGARKVIVIEDDPAVRDSLKLLLAARCEDVCDFASAEEFLADGGRDSDTCLIIDVELPGIDGLELVWRLAADEGRVRAVLISGRADHAMRRRAARIGVAELLDKPVSFDDLLAAIARTMR